MKLALKIENFGPINEAQIDIGKINIIAGQNSSGKTTTSKLFYCLLASVSSDGKYLADRSIIRRLSIILDALLLKTTTDNIKESEIFTRIFLSLNQLQKRPNISGLLLREIFNEMVNSFNKLELKNRDFYEEEFDKINQYLKINEDSAEYHRLIMKTLLEIEFDGGIQIIRNFNDSKVFFYGENKGCKFEKNIVTTGTKSKEIINKDYLDCIKVNEVCYMETPYVLDFISLIDFDSRSSDVSYHQKLLMNKLSNSPAEDVYDEVENEILINFQDDIEKILEGKFKFDSESKNFLFEQYDKIFTMKNTASGLKQLGIIQLLLNNRKLIKNSYLIMDEPEVHLHPEWQVKLAEIIVLLAKKLNITLYINSHSPQFIEAIQVYSEKYEILKDTNFYLTKKDEETDKFNFIKIEDKDLDIIYKNLGDPYDIIDKIIGENLANNLKGRD